MNFWGFRATEKGGAAGCTRKNRYSRVRERGDEEEEEQEHEPAECEKEKEDTEGRGQGGVKVNVWGLARRRVRRAERKERNTEKARPY